MRFMRYYTAFWAENIEKDACEVMNWMWNLSAVILAVTALFALTRQLHMLQLNSYYLSRYYGWLKGAFSMRTVVSGLLFAAFVLLLIFQTGGVPALALSALCAAVRVPLAFSDYKTSIKKIVFTARVGRLYAAAAIFLALPILIAQWIPAVGMILLLLLTFATPALLALCKWVNTPVETAVANHYIQDAKRRLREQPSLKIIGVTGSYGKTSTKHALGRMLSERYNVLITPGSFNTPMGVVRTVREQLKATTQVFVVEMGAKNVGDIKEICEIADPQMAVITSVGPQHLDTFGSIENVVKTKFELADWVGAKGGAVFLNCDNALISRKAGGYSTAVTYGTDPALDFHAENIVYSKSGSSFDIVGDGRRISASTRMLGRHNVLNITAAAAVAVHMGLTDSEIKYAVSAMKPVAHRLEMKSFLGGSILIDDAYNANPEGCLEAVHILSHFDGMKKVVVTPGLVELGEQEYESNYNLGLAAANTCDIIILVGEKRAVPMADAIATTPFDKEQLHIVKSFQDAMTLMQGFLSRDYVVLFENDLPDNYAG